MIIKCRHCDRKMDLAEFLTYAEADLPWDPAPEEQIQQESKQKNEGTIV